MKEINEILLLYSEEVDRTFINETMALLGMIYSEERILKKEVDGFKLSYLQIIPNSVLIFYVKRVDDELTQALAKHAEKSLVLVIYEGNDQMDIYRLIRANSHGIISISSWSDLPKAIEELREKRHFICQNILRTFVDKSYYTNQSNRLSSREIEVIHLMAKGLTYMEISDELSISYDTTKTHIYNIYRKLGVRNKTEAVYKARTSMILT